MSEDTGRTRDFYAGKTLGRMEREEEIIELLEETLKAYYNELSGEMEWGLHKAIATIKGQTK